MEDRGNVIVRYLCECREKIDTQATEFHETGRMLIEWNYGKD